MSDPRVARTRASVIEATLALLRDDGASAFSIGAVARRAGVARTSIYRQWADASELLTDALEGLRTPASDPEPGTVQSELVALYSSLNRDLAKTEFGRLLPVVLDLVQRDSSFDRVHRRLVEDGRRPALDAVRRGIKHGSILAATVPEQIVDRIAGPIFYRCLVMREPFSQDDVERLVLTVLSSARSDYSTTSSDSIPDPR